MVNCLHGYLLDSATEHSKNIAIADPVRGNIDYQELNALSDRFRDYLISNGVKPGDRVGVWMPKAVDTVVCIYGILKSGAAYVPVDSSGPADRAAYIFNDCSVRAVVVEKSLSSVLSESLGSDSGIHLIGLDANDRPDVLAVKELIDDESISHCESPSVGGNDLAYILYTSGSTGTPKGVQVSHSASMAFVDWAYSVVKPEDSDIFSSHAPFHFDLSIFDLYVSAKSGGRVVLISEDIGKEPVLLAQLIAQYKINIWYSAPSILNMLLEYGNIKVDDFEPMRFIIFAGEVFPVKQLKKLTKVLPNQTYFNFYGPTETNVCTYARVPDQFYAEECEALPIGHVCEHLSSMVVGSDGKEVKRGETGELLIRGANLMQGYWNLPDRTQASFLKTDSGEYYHTGDLVFQQSDDQYVFVGRNDRMIKKRGYRIELGEIEAIALKHDSIIEACAIAKEGKFGVYIYLHYSSRDGKRLSGIALKKYCSTNLQKYMVPDGFLHHSVLPKTSTDKIDMQALKSATPDRES